MEAFLGRIADPPSTPGPDPGESEIIADPAFRVIMFTDMKDATATTTRLGDAAALFLFRTHNSIARDALKAHCGREVRHTGDGFMVSFTSAFLAAACAVTMQQKYASHNRHHPDSAMHVRIGICAGEPVEEDRRLFGATVQLAARICDTAAPDQILVAPVVRD